MNEGRKAQSESNKNSSRNGSATKNPESRTANMSREEVDDTASEYTQDQVQSVKRYAFDLQFFKNLINI